MDGTGKPNMQGSLAYTETDVMTQAVDVYRPINIEKSLRESTTLTHRPVTMSQTGPWQFNITPTGEQYIQMNQIRLYMKCKILTAAGEEVAADVGIGVCNLPMNSLIQQIDIDIGGQTISELQNSHVNYKAYLETLLSYSQEAAQGHLAASLWAPDTATVFDDVRYEKDALPTSTANTINKGLIYRRTMVDGPWDAMIPLHCDFFNCDRFLPSGVGISVTLTRAKDSFVLMHPESTTTYKIHIDELLLHVPYITLSPNLVAEHKALATKGHYAQLPIKKTEVSAFHYGAGATNIKLTNLYQYRLPSTLIIGMLNTGHYNGSVTTNPYYFKNFSLNYLQISRNGKSIPLTPYTPDFANGIYNRELRGFYDNTGIGTDNLGNCVTSRMFKDGACLFPFDFTPEKCNGFHQHEREAGGTMDIELKFKDATPAGGITIMLFAVFDAVVGLNIYANNQSKVVVAYP